jgi:hypothetical protein
MTYPRIWCVGLFFSSLIMLVAFVWMQPAPASVLNETPPDNAAWQIKSAEDVQRIVSSAAAADRAIMFIHVDWALMDAQRMRFDQLVSEYLRLHPRENVEFYYVDCTSVTEGYAPLRQLRGWKELEHATATSLIHGWGEIVYLERGRVLRVEPLLNSASTAESVRRTEWLLSND